MRLATYCSQVHVGLTWREREGGGSAGGHLGSPNDPQISHPQKSVEGCGNTAQCHCGRVGGLYMPTAHSWVLAPPAAARCTLRARPRACITPPGGPAPRMGPVPRPSQSSRLALACTRRGTNSHEAALYLPHACTVPAASHQTTHSPVAATTALATATGRAAARVQGSGASLQWQPALQDAFHHPEPALVRRLKHGRASGRSTRS